MLVLLHSAKLTDVGTNHNLSNINQTQPKEDHQFRGHPNWKDHYKWKCGAAWRVNQTSENMEAIFMTPNHYY